MKNEYQNKKIEMLFSCIKKGNRNPVNQTISCLNPRTITLKQ